MAAVVAVRPLQLKHPLIPVVGVHPGCLSECLGFVQVGKLGAFGRAVVVFATALIFDGLVVFLLDGPDIVDVGVGLCEGLFQ